MKHDPAVGSTHQQWVLPTSSGPYPPAVGPTHQQWTLPTSSGPYPPAVGPIHQQWALPTTSGPYPPAVGPIHQWIYNLINIFVIIDRCDCLKNYQSTSPQYPTAA